MNANGITIPAMSAMVKPLRRLGYLNAMYSPRKLVATSAAPINATSHFIGFAHSDSFSRAGVGAEAVTV